MSEERDTAGRFVEGHTHIPGGAWTPKIARTPENAAYICERVMAGDKLDTIAKDMGAAGRTTIMMWMAQDADFQAMFWRAKAAMADGMADDILEIADDATDDWKTITTARGTTFQLPDREATSRSKLRVETRLKLMASYAPQRYGAKVEVEHNVADSFADRLVRARERALERMPEAIEHQAAAE